MSNPRIVGLARIINARGGWLHDGTETRGAIGPHEQFRLAVHGDGYAILSPDGSEYWSFNPDGSWSWRKNEPGQPGPWEIFDYDPPNRRLVSRQFPQNDFFLVGQLPNVTPAPIPPTLPQLVVSGTTLQSRGQFFNIGGISLLTALADDVSEDRWHELFQLCVREGVNFGRTFGGSLRVGMKRPQTAASARARMPRYLDVAASYGIGLEITLLTDTKDGYDPEEHLRLSAPMTLRDGVITVVCNEWGHGTQTDQVNDPETLRRWGQQYFSQHPVWSIGAPVDSVWDVNGREYCRDEPSPVDLAHPAGAYEFRGRGGSLLAGHLDRSRESWDNLRRDKEGGHDAAHTEHAPYYSAEPRRDYLDPTWYAALGGLQRGLSSAGGIHHTAWGLEMRLPNPDELARLRAFISARRLVDEALGGQPGRYYNSDHHDSPVGRYSKEDWDHYITRHYSFVFDDRHAVSLPIGMKPKPDGSYVTFPWANGWQPVQLLGEWRSSGVDHDMPAGEKFQIWEIAR